jgi:glycerol-3-phosphate acyltransferase PlsY
VFPIFLGGRGGKGVAVSTGAFFALDPFATLMAGVVFGVTVSIGRMISLGSILAAMALPVAFDALEAPMEYQWVARGVAVLVIVLHWPNIKRLWQGTEPKISQRVKLHE